MKLLTYVSGSFAVAGGVIAHAFWTREQFYPSVLYLTSSKICLVTIANCLLALLLCGHALLVKLFFGRLSNGEQERLIEKAKDAVMETCLAMTIFRQEFKTSFLLLFTLLLFLKVFHWIAMDRVEYAETVSDVSVFSHVRVAVLMLILLAGDAMFLMYSLRMTVETGPSVLLLFAFEYVILATMTISGLCRYGFYYIDHVVSRRNAALNAANADAAGGDADDDDDDLDGGAGSGAGAGWEGKGVAIFYLGLITDMVQLLVYFVFFIVILTHYGMPLHLIRDLYVTFRNFRARVSDFIRYRRITSNMHRRFPDATREDIEREPTCIVCREQMKVPEPGSANQPGGAARRDLPKVLPCGHAFHLGCLRSWLERQQSCPTCRAPVNISHPASSDAVGAGNANIGVGGQQPPQPPQPELNQQQQQQQQQANIMRHFQQNFGTRAPPATPPAQQQHDQQIQQQQQQQQSRPRPEGSDDPSARTSGDASTSSTATRSAPSAVNAGARASTMPAPMMVAMPQMYGQFPVLSAPLPTTTASLQHQLLDTNTLMRSLSESQAIMDTNNVPPEYQQLVVSMTATAAAAAAESAAAMLPLATLPSLFAVGGGADDAAAATGSGSEDEKIPESINDLDALFRRYRGIVGGSLRRRERHGGGGERENT